MPAYGQRPWWLQKLPSRRVDAILEGLHAEWRRLCRDHDLSAPYDVMELPPSTAARLLVEEMR
jgi:hypothetical protein